MADTSRTLKVIFDGAVSGLRAAAAQARAAISGVDGVLKKHKDGLEQFNGVAGKVVKSFLAIGAGAAAVSGSANIIAGVAAALTTVAPAALLIPGAVLAGAAAMATFKIATAGFGDALKAGLSGDLAKFAESTKGMAPAMREAASAVVSFKPQIDDLKKTVQQNFWQGFSGGINEVGKNLLPTLKEGLGAVAGSLNEVALGALDVVKTPLFSADISQILFNTTDAISAMAPALGKVLSGFVGLGVVGSTYLPRLGKAIDNVASRFKDWVDRGLETGRINDWIDGAIAGFKAFGLVVSDIFVGGKQAIASFAEGLGPGGLLGGISAAAYEFNKFTTSTEGQAFFKGLGEAVSAVSTAFREVLFTALKELGPILKELSPFIVAAAKAIGEFLVGAIKTAGPILKDLAKFLSDNKDVIVPLIPLLLSAAVGIKGLLIAKSVIANVRALGTALGFLKTKAGLWGLGIVAAADIAVGAIKGYSEEQDKAFAKGGFGGDIKTFVEEFKVEPLQAIGKEIRASLTPPEETVGLWQRISQSFQTDFIDVFAAAPARIKESFNTDFLGFFAGLGTQIAEKFTGMRTAISTKFNEIVTDVQALPGRIGTAIAAFGTDLYNRAVTAWQQFRDGALAKFDEIDGDARDLPTRIGTAIGSLIGILISKAIEAWNAFYVTSAQYVNIALNFVHSIPQLIRDGIAALRGYLEASATNSWEGFHARIVQGTNIVLNFVRGIPGFIGDALGALGTLLVNAGRSIIDGLLAGIKDGYNAMIGFVKGIAGGIAANKGPLSYDKTVLVPAGLALMQGLRNGLDQGYGAVLSDVAAMAGGINAQLSGGIGSLGTLNPGGLAARLPASAAQTAAAISGAPAPVTYVTVKIGDTELRGIVDTQVESTNREVARVVGAGAGR